MSAPTPSDPTPWTPDPPRLPRILRLADTARSVSLTSSTRCGEISLPPSHGAQTACEAADRAGHRAIYTRIEYRVVLDAPVDNQELRIKSPIDDNVTLIEPIFSWTSCAITRASSSNFSALTNGNTRVICAYLGRGSYCSRYGATSASNSCGRNITTAYSCEWRRLNASVRYCSSSTVSPIGKMLSRSGDFCFGLRPYRLKRFDSPRGQTISSVRPQRHRHQIIRTRLARFSESF